MYLNLMDRWPSGKAVDCRSTDPAFESRSVLLNFFSFFQRLAHLMRALDSPLVSSSSRAFLVGSPPSQDHRRLVFFVSPALAPA